MAQVIFLNEVTLRVIKLITGNQKNCDRRSSRAF